MSQRGKTVLKGHGLLCEGAALWLEDGRVSYNADHSICRAKCSCGAVSPPGLSMNANKRWHREHKDALR